MTDDMGAIFREELRDLLESLERGLLDLKKRPADMALVNQVFRDLHTVKGSGAMFGFTDLAAFIHEFETVFDRIRSGALAVGAEILRLALAAKDEIPGLVDGEPDPEGRRGAILAGLRAIMAGEVAEVAAVPGEVAVEPQTAGPSRLQFRLSGAALAMGARPEIVLDELRALGATGIVADLAEVPPLDRLDVEACAFGWSMHLPATVTPAQVEEVFLFVDAEWSLEADAAPAATVAEVEVAAPALVGSRALAWLRGLARADSAHALGVSRAHPAGRWAAADRGCGVLYPGHADRPRRHRDAAVVAVHAQAFGDA